MDEWLTVDEAGRALGVSLSTIWRMIGRGELASIRARGRRLVRCRPLRPAGRSKALGVAPFGPEHPIFRLVGAGHGGGVAPGARDKHEILDR
jgi:excisionase family DNA binding protein